MVITMKDAYNNFMLKYEEEKIGVTSFCKLKPQHVRQVSETNRRSCLCAICCNVALKAESINKLINSSDVLKRMAKEMNLKVGKKILACLHCVIKGK